MLFLVIDYLDMVNRLLLPILTFCILVTACAAPTAPTSLEPTEEQATATADVMPLVETSTSEPELIVVETTIPGKTELVGTQEAECPGEETNTIGQGIADEYEFTSYDEVMTWFCDGAEFEDILVALQTEELSDTPAEEMLVMVAEGFTWEDIWLIVGLTE
jgi:hypothetical protein